MVATVQYTALRSLYGVSSGVLVTLDLPVRYAGITVSKKAYGTTRISMAGRRERYHERIEHVYQISSTPMTEPIYRRLRMFLDSVDQLESFLFSPDTSALTTAYLEDIDYTETMLAERDSMRTVGFAIVVPA